MPNLPFSIELHDSDLSEIRLDEGNAVIVLAPAYIHKDGKGWLQSAEIKIGKAKVSGSIQTPSLVYDGWLKTELGPYHNLLEIPFETSGVVELSLELGGGETVTIVGEGISHNFIGELRYLEQC